MEESSTNWKVDFWSYANHGSYDAYSSRSSNFATGLRAENDGEWMLHSARPSAIKNMVLAFCRLQHALDREHLFVKSERRFIHELENDICKHVEVCSFELRCERIGPIVLPWFTI